MIEEADRARRLARAIAADISLYNQAQIDEGVREGTLDVTMAAVVDEGRALFESRVAPSLLVRSRFYDAALVEMFRPRIHRPAWETGFDRLRARLAQYSACVVCHRSLGPERIAFHGSVEQQWLLLLGCASCLAVTGIIAAPDANLVPEAHLEAGAAVVIRLRERLTRAREAGALEAEVESIEADPVLGRLLGVPEVSSDAEPASGTLRVASDVDVLDPLDWWRSPWPGAPPRLAPVELLQSQASPRIGHALGYLGRRPGGWLLASPQEAWKAPAVDGVMRWVSSPVVSAERGLVKLEVA